MYSVTGVHLALCRFFRNTLGVCIQSCGKYNHCYWGQHGWFSFLNWLILFFNGIGLVTSAGKFCDIIWYARIYDVLDGKFLTSARIVGSFLQLSSYILVIIGQVTENPVFISLWIVIRAITLTLHFILWINDIRVGKISLRWQELLRFILRFSFVLCVDYVETQFYEAIVNGEKDFVTIFMGAK